jgi:hypothetical protein
VKPAKPGRYAVRESGKGGEFLRFVMYPTDGCRLGEEQYATKFDDLDRAEMLAYDAKRHYGRTFVVVDYQESLVLHLAGNPYRVTSTITKKMKLE